MHEERRHGASPARRTRERRWRTGPVMVAGLVALAVGSSGCAAILAQHKVAASHASSAAQGSGNSVGGTGSAGGQGALVMPARQFDGRRPAGRVNNREVVVRLGVVWIQFDRFPQGGFGGEVPRPGSG